MENVKVDVEMELNSDIFDLKTEKDFLN